MNDLIYDAFSIFTQLASITAPEYADTIEIQLTAYIFGCVFIMSIVWTLLRIVSAVPKVIMQRFGK